VFVRVERLLTKLRQPASRADELNALRDRFRRELAAEPTEEERALGREVQDAKLRAAATLGTVTSCASCSSDRYSGGACCSGVTESIFDDREVAALVHGGTRPRDLVPPPRSDDHVGCAFRGPRACTLELVHRPARCVHYVCDTLRRELHTHDRLDAVEARLAELNAAVQTFGKLHAERVDREVLAPLVAALEASARTQ
jgi:hypothetical protein